MTNGQAKDFCIGIFGGSFDPPHIGHRRAARGFCNLVKPDLLMVIPSFIPPHKKLCGAKPAQRLEMAKLAFCDVYDKVEISDCEIKRGGKSYTLYTVNEIREKYPGAGIALFVGSDMLLSFDSWFCADELFRLCRLCVMPRFDDRPLLEKKAEEYRNKFGADISFIDGQFYALSSTQLREAAAKGDMDFLMKNLSEKVLNYIIKENLYGKG